MRSSRKMSKTNIKKTVKKMSKKLSRTYKKSSKTNHGRRVSKSKRSKKTSKPKVRRSKKMLGGAECMTFIIPNKGTVKICKTHLAKVQSRLVNLIDNRDAVKLAPALTPEEKEAALKYAKQLLEYVDIGKDQVSPHGLTQAFKVLSKDNDYKDMLVFNLK